MKKSLLFFYGIALSVHSFCQPPVCHQQPGQIPDFSRRPVQVNPANLSEVVHDNGVYSAGEVFRYTNAVTIPANINAYVYVEAVEKATIIQFDNNNAGVRARFQPTIQPRPANLTEATQEGWVQFRIEFRYNGGPQNGQLVNLAAGLQFRHFDIDGYTRGSTGSFRETGWTTGQLNAYLIAPTDLTNGGNVTDAGPPNPATWIKVIGQSSEHAGPSSDPNVSYTSQFGAVNTVRFRMGYLFVKGNGHSVSNQPAREYAAEFGCFDLTNNIPLPVKLTSFGAAFKNDKVNLNWSTADETNFSRFEVERSTNGTEFATAGIVFPNGGPRMVANYEFPDNLANVTGNVFYYRLKMIDDDGRFSYSQVVLVKKEGIAANELSLFPNPVTGDFIQVRMNAISRGKVEIRIIDLNGKLVMRQIHTVYDGNNTIPVKLPPLQSGSYALQVISSERKQTVKFSVTH